MQRHDRWRSIDTTLNRTKTPTSTSKHAWPDPIAGFQRPRPTVDADPATSADRCNI
jgi:hypothetical protein